MSLGWYTVDINSAKEGLDPLLPHVAGVIENMEEATITDIKSQVEKDMNSDVSWTGIVNALENGVRLGLFNMEREFKVCREFTSKEIQKVNNLDFSVTLPKEVSPFETGKRGRALMDYVKQQREKRRRKLYKGKGGRYMVEARSFGDNNEVYSQLCRRCRKSIEKKLSPSGKDSQMSSEEENLEKASLESDDSSSPSEVSNVSEVNSRSSQNDSKVPQKSRLLVEKNPMETDPPYYDIFT